MTEQCALEKYPIDILQVNFETSWLALPPVPRSAEREEVLLQDLQLAMNLTLVMKSNHAIRGS
jgi:hypothetical protein